jgi:hypothetical protein
MGRRCFDLKGFRLVSIPLLSAIFTVRTVHRGLLALACVFLAQVLAHGTTNSITIYEKAGVTTTNYPVQIGRPFVQGEIAGCPQAVIAGTPVTTQANVMSRWTDGSAKHAILSFLLPSLASNGSVKVTFQNQASCNTTPLSKAQMEDASYGFNAQMALTSGGTTVNADAFTMLDAGDYTVWTSGSVAQTIIIADHTQTQTCNTHACSKYDIGFDANKVFRPIVYATFWPSLHKVKIRFVGEIANTEALEDQAYSLVLKTGKASPAQVYSHATFTHTAMSRWTVGHPNNSSYADSGIWINGAPGNIAIDHNLAYLSSTTLIPNFDNTKGTSVPAQVASFYSNWHAAAPDIYYGSDSTSFSFWTKAMDATGDNANLGIYTLWIANWLFDMTDPKAAEMAFGNSDIGGAWPFHLREGGSARKITKSTALGCAYQCDASGVGKIVSIVGRPTYTSINPQLNADHPAFVGAHTSGGWTNGTNDPAHLPDSWTVPYLLTGDHFYYEESLNFAAWSVANSNPNGLNYGRPSQGRIAILSPLQTRGQGWALRMLANTASIAPDDTPEKSYLESAITESLAEAEGVHNITGGTYVADAVAAWNFGRNVVRPSIGESPLHLWTSGSADLRDCSTVDCTVASQGISPWEQSIVLMGLGRAKELGFGSGRLLTWLAAHYAGALSDSSYSPYLIAVYREPTTSTATGTWFQTWAEQKAAFTAAAQARGASYWINNLYAELALFGVSYLTGESGGGAAWAFVKAHSLDVDTVYNTDPRYAVVPRIVPCDLNADDRIDLLDVQSAISQILVPSSCSTADLQQTGTCDIVDVQRVIAAALGAACAIGR